MAYEVIIADTRDKSIIRSLMFYACSWLDPLFLTGCRRELTHKDLYVHPGEAESAKLLHRFNR